MWRGGKSEKVTQRERGGGVTEQRDGRRGGREREIVETGSIKTAKTVSSKQKEQHVSYEFLK